MHNPFRGGTFDDWYSGYPNDLWIEYKYQVSLGSVKPALSPLQYLWGSQRFDEGRNVAVIVGMPQGGIVLYREEWESRIPVLEVERRLIKRKDLARLILIFISRIPQITGDYELADFVHELAS